MIPADSCLPIAYIFCVHEERCSSVKENALLYTLLNSKQTYLIMYDLHTPDIVTEMLKFP